MKILLKLIFCFYFSHMAFAQQTQPLRFYHWKNRVLIVFSATEQSDQYKQQIQLLEKQEEELNDRDLVTFKVFKDHMINPAGKSLGKESADELRDKYKVKEGEFAILLIGKDGTLKIKQETLLPTDHLFATIDSMPMRQQEMRNGN